MDKKILVIDDDLQLQNQRDVFCLNYPLEGYSYIFVADGKEAQKILQNNDEGISLILLDIRFEGMENNHGLRILSQLVESGCSIPIAMLSSITDASVIIEAWQKGAKTYLVKWGENNNFYEQLREVVAQYALAAKPSDRNLINIKRKRILTDTDNLLKTLKACSLSDVIEAANRLRDEVGAQWMHEIPFSEDFGNYINGWNSTERELEDATKKGKLLYLNMDFGDGCTLNCPHCFTKEGAIDERGREPLAYDLLKEQILEARKLGLKAVRILGRGEPTQWISGDWKGSPEKGADLIDFIKFLRNNDIIPLIFTRGQILGDDSLIERFYGGAHGVRNGDGLARLFRDFDVSVFLGFSSLFPPINNEMVGRGERQNYDRTCRNAMRLLIKHGFNGENPTRMAVEAPITNLNIYYMLVRYVFFQMLNISPCSNVYMVTGRTMTYRLGELSDPGQAAFVEMYCAITRFKQLMGIKGKIGSYAGIKECHDVQFGMYLTLNGDIYPCPGYEGIHNYVGSLRSNSISEIWKNNPYAVHPQSICPPRIATHFPPDFERVIELKIHESSDRYDALFNDIYNGLRKG
ncbi:MAG: response regulator [Nitrospirae bacterium]|nr:response regulator [Nitrospirota bacterium]